MKEQQLRFTKAIFAIASGISVVSGFHGSFNLPAAAQSPPPTADTLPPGTPERVDQTFPTPRELAPPLPVPPAPNPAPNLQTPDPADSSPLDLPDESFPIQEVQVVGHTVLHTEIAEIVAEFLSTHETATFDDLIELRTALTQLGSPIS